MKVAALSFLGTAVGHEAVQHPRGYKRSAVADNEIFEVAEITEEMIAAAPNAVDWSAQGATTSVNEQGSCGSCWAFSTMQGVESAVYMSTGALPPKLSVQQLVACEKQDDGCDGGDIPEAVSYLKKKGMATEADYPDTSSKIGRSGSCKSNWEPTVSVSGMKYAIPTCKKKNCGDQDEEALAAALAQYGPISVCINSGDEQTGDWMPYTGGILKGSCKANANLVDHCVQLVGYDKSAGYWKVRNSWGTSWGEGGFIRLPYGNQNSCCLGCEAVIISATTIGPAPRPTPTPSPSPTPSPAPSPTPAPTPTPSEWCPHPDCPRKCQTFAEDNCGLEQFAGYDDCLSCTSEDDKTYIWCDPKYRKAYCRQIGSDAESVAV